MAAAMLSTHRAGIENDNIDAAQLLKGHDDAADGQRSPYSPQQTAPTAVLESSEGGKGIAMFARTTPPAEF